MKTYSDSYGLYERAPSKQPLFVVRLSWDSADTDYTYLTSSADCALPTSSPAVDSIQGTVLAISGQTQKINPDIANSTIGGITIKLSDVTSNDSPPLTTQITTKMNTKLVAGDGLRGKVVRVYVGYEAMPFTSYDLRLTYVIDSVSYKDGIYTIAASDIQRAARHKLFTPDETTLNSSISATDLIIPVVSIDTTLFPAVTHGAEWDIRPSQTVAFIKIEKEVICITGGISFDTTNGWHCTALSRGALNTVAVEHTVDSGTTDSRKPKVKEHVYLEGAAPKVIYAILTGQLLNGNSPEDTLPDHWHLGISTSFVRLTDFKTLGDDLWNDSDDSGKKVRIENPGTQDGKKYIEKEMLLWMGCFMPVYSTGELGLKKLSGVLSDASYLATFDKYNITDYSSLDHDMKSVINDIRVKWNWVDSKEVFTKDSVFIDQDSIDKHGTADTKEFKFKTVYTGLHTDEDLFTYFDVLRSRYSGPPLLIDIKALPSMGYLEVGDTVRVVLDQVRDMTKNTTLDRTFEIQQVQTNWSTGALSFKLFGSSQKAGELTRTSLSTVLLDTFYTQEGTSLDSSDSPAGPLTIVAGHVTANGTITGHATDIDDATAIYYYDGDLTINSGVTVTIQENVQLRIKGALSIIGTIDGIGNGATGGAATSQFDDASTSDTYSAWNVTPFVPLNNIDYDEGEQGYFGNTISAESLAAQGVGGTTTILACDSMTTTSAADTPGVWAGNPSILYGTLSNGVVNEVPWFQITNDQQTNTLTGYRTNGATYPGDFRGNSGAGGVPFIRSSFVIGGNSTRYIIGNGGAGGDGGAGLMIVSRGMSFSGAGKINLSGGDSSAGQSVTAVGATVYAGSGAPGAPGALVVFLDGDVTPPDITESTFVADYGNVGYAASTDLLSREDISVEVVITPYGSFVSMYTAGVCSGGAGTWPHTNGVYAGPPGAATQYNADLSLHEAAHRLQYIPEDETPVYDVPDSSVFDPVFPWEFSEINVLQQPTPAANDYFGTDVDLTETGARMVISLGTGAGYAVKVLRNIHSAASEQTISDTTGGVGRFGYNIGISLAGDRLFISAERATVSGHTRGGEVQIYSRSGVTWSLEQTLTESTVTTNADYGKTVRWNNDANKIIIGYTSTVYTLYEYWDRSGTTWTRRTAPSAPSPSSGFYPFHIMSHGGNAWIGSDIYWATGAIQTGGAHVYDRNGTSWDYVTTLVPTTDGVIKWAYGHYSCDYHGTAITITGSDSGSPNNLYVAVYHRIGNTFILLQIMQNPIGEPTGGFGDRAAMSSDGLTLVVDDRVHDRVFIYRRSNIAEPFSEYQYISDQDIGGPTSGYALGLSPSGKILAMGNNASDLNASNAGAVYLWQTLAS